MHLPEHNSIKKLQCHFFMRWPTYSSSELMLRKRKFLNILWYVLIRKFGLFLQGYSHIIWLRKRKEGWLFSWQGPYLHYVLAQQKTAASLRGHSLSRGVWRRRPPLELYQFSRYASVPPPLRWPPCRRTVGQDRQKCKETSNLDVMWYLLPSSGYTTKKGWICRKHKIKLII